MNIRTLKEAVIQDHARVLIRADFDVTTQNGIVKDDFRIRKVLPSLEYVLKRGGLPRLISHLGRPKSKEDQNLSLRPVAKRLEQLLNKEIFFIEDPFAPEIFEQSGGLEKIILFENIRFWEEEKGGSDSLAEKLRKWGEIYINEAFADSHRGHASIVNLPRLLPSYAGLQLEQEINSLEKIIDNPAKPLVALLGGAKLETKLPLIKNLLDLGASVLIGGRLVTSLFLASGFKINESCGEKENLRYLQGLNLKHPNLYLPRDVVVAESPGSPERLAVVHQLGERECVFDIGTQTIQLFSLILKSAKTIFWNGPLGVVEEERFTQGTLEIVKIILATDAFKITGGGDSIAFLDQRGLLAGFNHISTGGGSMLEFLAGKKMPGIEVLRK